MPYKNKDDHRKYQQQLMLIRSIQRRKATIAGLGGQCRICGYKKCYKALDTHHIDPKNKNFTMSKMQGLKKETIIEEARKTILLCANCHREVENCNKNIQNLKLIFSKEEFEREWEKHSHKKPKI